MIILAGMALAGLAYLLVTVLASSRIYRLGKENAPISHGPFAPWEAVADGVFWLPVALARLLIGVALLPFAVLAMTTVRLAGEPYSLRETAVTWLRDLLPGEHIFEGGGSDW